MWLLMGLARRSTLASTYSSMRVVAYVSRSSTRSARWRMSPAIVASSSRVNGNVFKAWPYLNEEIAHAARAHRRVPRARCEELRSTTHRDVTQAP